MSLLSLVSSVAAPATLNLTTEGTIDWAHWGAVDANSFNHRAGITQQISDLIMVNGAVRNRWADPSILPACSWTGGTPTAAGSGLATEIAEAELNRGYRITCPAAQSTRVLTLYVKPYRSTLTYTASLSDSSATPVTTTVTNANYGYQAIALSFNATNTGVTLSVDIIQTAESNPLGNIALVAATLKPLAGALTLVLNPASPSQGVSAGSAITPVAVSVNGGVSPYTLQAIGLPAGVTLVQNADQATISGTPTSPGDYLCFVSATDAAGQIQYSLTWGLRVLPSGRPKAVWLGR